MSGLEKSILMDPRNQQNVKALENALASQSIFQLGLLLVLPMVMEVGLEKGFRTALGEFVIMQLQLASVFFTFQLGTKTHYYGRTILHGGAKYRPTGRGFVVYHAKFAENYRLYSRSLRKIISQVEPIPLCYLLNMVPCCFMALCAIYLQSIML